MKRRSFIGRLGLGAAGVGLATSCTNTNSKVNSENQLELLPPEYPKTIKKTFSTSNAKGANDKLVLALIGAGNWGTVLTQTLVGLNRNTDVKYICDVDDTRGGRAISEIEKVQGYSPKRVRDMRHVFDDKEVDGVIIATPQHWHALASIWAMQAGKDVYLEKCISHNISEGQKLIEAAMKYERILQCGMQNRSAPYNMNAKKYIESGALGQIVAVDVMELDTGPVPFKEKIESSAPDTIDWDLWLGPAPKVPYSISRNKSWNYYWDYSGGAELANGAIHQVDLARFVLGDPAFPKSVYCAGGRYLFEDNRDIPDYQMTTYDYGNFVMTLQTGAFTPYMAKSSPEIRYGNQFPEWKQNCDKIIIYGTKQQMYLGRMGGGWQVFEANGEVVAQEHGYFPLEAHMGNFVDCMRSRNHPNTEITEGHKSSVLMHLANISYRVGSRQLDFSAELEAITNNTEAGFLARGTYRKGFELPVII